MPVHDWSRVEAGIFHDFHHAWIEEIKRALNDGILPPEFYALAEQRAAGFGPDVLTLQSSEGRESGWSPHSANGGLLLAPPKVPLTAETDLGFYRRKQDRVVVRHVSGDEIVAMVEVVSPGNKSGRQALEDFVKKACELLSQRIHLLILDVQPRGTRDPNGIHGEIWEAMTGQEYAAPADRPLTLAAYDADSGVKAFVQHLAVGEPLIEMPLFLEFGGRHVEVPLERTYESAFAAMPRRWQTVLEKRSEAP
jgi:hypothetical protein